MTKIAIIEDDPTINQMYRMKFEAAGFEVATASDGAIGIQIVESFKPDIILLDIQMPHMRGDEALTHIRATNKTVPVIILTNLGKEEAPVALKSLGVSSYIVKAEFTPSQVVGHVKQTLNLS